MPGPNNSMRPVPVFNLPKGLSNVHRDIRTMLDELKLDPSKFGSVYVDAKGEKRSACCLPKDLTITLVSGYNVTMRHRIVTRWMELEEAAKPATWKRQKVCLSALQAPRQGPCEGIENRLTGPNKSE
ncbi:hypothetical protein ZRA01_27010 [Zoogloea ramigera]|uniref:Uncharacterized protein n=1 Tax=Zoogloea ramigera TaxID=350 RepID=A0A4Y4CUQ4_ZOORA|nr:Rha family transcriptional regulator [Zoogloea ramigera]GEC96628.1 hypothetical protein ZRA01_27010 [Zoogloea ramigera]